MQRVLVVLIAVCLFTARNAVAQETFFKEDGVTYRQRKWVERRPVADTQWEESAQTQYKERYVTEMRDSYRPVYSPVTDYQMQPRWHNWWNPFGRPYVAYHMLPRTRWETRYERYQSPVTVREVVPETRTVMTPRRTTRFVEEEVTETVAIPPRLEAGQLARAPIGSTRVATRQVPAYGGIERYSDPSHRR